MSSEFGGLQVHNSSTVVHTLSTGTELSGVILTWAAIAAATHGAASISASTSTGRLTLKAGTYRIDVDLSVENQTVSGLSSEDVTVQGVIDFHLARGQAAGANPAEISGTSTRATVEEGLSVSVHITAFVEITAAEVAAGTNYISVFAKTALDGASLNDIVISQARFLAQRMD